MWCVSFYNGLVALWVVLYMCVCDYNRSLIHAMGWQIKYSAKKCACFALLCYISKRIGGIKTNKLNIMRICVCVCTCVYTCNHRTLSVSSQFHYFKFNLYHTYALGSDAQLRSMYVCMCMCVLVCLQFLHSNFQLQ